MDGRNHPRTYRANKLARIRVLLGLTQDEAARRIGVHRVSLANWENGECKPSSENLVKLAKLYGCTMEDLVS